MITLSVFGLQVAAALLSLTVFGVLLIGPHYEGRNQDASWSEIYFNDPLLAYVYLGSISFFATIYHLFRFLHYLQNASLSRKKALYRLQQMRFYLMILLGFIVGFLVYLVVVQRRVEEDITAGISMSMLVLLLIGLAIATTIKIEKMLQTRIIDKEEL